jgi:type I restriction enzyme S subunit
MSEWKEYKLGDLTIDGKGSYGIAASAIEFDASKYTYLRITDINDDGTINKNGLKSVDDVNASNYLLKPNDIVFARTGASVGRSYFYDGKDGEFVYAGFLIKFSIDPNKVNPKILKYYTHSQPYYDWILSVDNGATRGNINAQTYSSMPIILPDRNRQDKIASILSSLDDKIDLLHRENKTLEAMAETLFRKWFIDKENDSTLEQIISIQNGYAFKSNDFKDKGDSQIVKIKNISNGIVDIDSTDWVDKKITNVLLSKFQLHSGDVIIAMTGAEIGKLGIVPNNNRNLWLNQRVGLVVEKYIGAKYLAYLQLKSDFGQDYIENTATGSAQPNISGLGIEKCGFPKLGGEDIVMMSKQIGSFYDKIVFNLGQIRIITQTRDSLLPKLMSGEIKV